MWTRFFPLTYELRRLLSQSEVGDVQIVRTEIGNLHTHTPRCVEKKLGGGALLVVGIYCLHFVFMVFNGEKPESIQATGHCLDTGKDVFFFFFYWIVELKKRKEKGIHFVTLAELSFLTYLLWKIHVNVRPKVNNIPHTSIFVLGVDGTTVLVLKFSRNRMAVCTCSVTSNLACDAVITGTKGTIKVTRHCCVKSLYASN